MIREPDPPEHLSRNPSPRRRFPSGVTMIGCSDTSRTLAATEVYLK